MKKSKGLVSGSEGKTLLELLVVITIIAILASLAIPLTSHFRRKAQDATCMSNLRSLHAYFSAYLLDHGMVWPQRPDGPDAESPAGKNDEVAEFWIKTLEPYGAHRQTFLCPSERSTFADNFDENSFDSSYGITEFDKTPNIAYQWPQPWAIERGGFHGGGVNMVMPDGSVKKDYLQSFKK